jgi:hypothetical protein
LLSLGLGIYRLGCSIWDVSLGSLSSGVVLWHLSFGICRLGSSVKDRSFEICNFGSFFWDLSLRSFAGDLSVGILPLGSLALEVSFGIFVEDVLCWMCHVGSFFWGRSPRVFRLGSFVWDLSCRLGSCVVILLWGSVSFVLNISLASILWDLEFVLFGLVPSFGIFVCDLWLGDQGSELGGTRRPDVGEAAGAGHSTQPSSWNMRTLLVNLVREKTPRPFSIC